MRNPLRNAGNSPLGGASMGKPVVIGLGGGGSRIIEELHTSLPDAARLISLDVDSEVFAGFFNGYCADVYPIVQDWSLRLAPKESLKSWFDSRGYFSPLRDIPDIFVRCTTRPIMRAAFLMHSDRIRAQLKEVLDSPEHVIIVCQTNGSTGSAWTLDVAEIVKDLSANARVRLVMIDGQFEGSGNLESIRCLANSYWTCREISSHEQFGKEALLFQTGSEATNYLSNMLTKIDNQTKPVSPQDFEDFQYQCAQQVFSSLQNSWDMERFFESRCRSVSSLIADAGRESLAGLLLAHAENRLEIKSERTSWDFLQIAARDSDELFRITVPKIDSHGASFISLALTDRGFGDQVHVESISALQIEGVAALNDNSFVVTDDCIAQLQEIRSQIFQRLEETAGINHLVPPSLKYIVDFYPVLLDLLDSMLERHHL
jgi:hypothetical protein